jgi:hypothetical protein
MAKPTKLRQGTDYDFVGSGTLPDGGRWFSVTLNFEGRPPPPGTAEEAERADKEWWEGGALEDERLETPDILYVETHPEERKTWAKLASTVDDGLHNDPEDENATVNLYFYEGTTDAKIARNSREAVELTIVSMMTRWKKSPYLSGTQETFPAHIEKLPASEFIERVFQISPSFYGVEP